MEAQFSPNYLERLMGHFDVCKDVCDDFGTNTILSPVQEMKMGRNMVVGFTVKSYRDTKKMGTFASDGNFNFAPDPYFDDDDWDVLEKQIRDSAAEEEEGDDDEEIGVEDSLPEIVDKVPDDDDKIINVSRTWVDKMMSDMGICPFTKGADLAGLPMGKVFYTVDRSTSVEDMYARYWKEVVRVEKNPEKELSTTLLIAPEFLLDNVEMFENFSSTLTQPLESLQVEVRTCRCIHMLFHLVAQSYHNITNVCIHSSIHPPCCRICSNWYFSILNGPSETVASAVEWDRQPTMPEEVHGQ